VGNLKVTLELPERPALAHLDNQMLGRALLNLVRNAMQATLTSGQSDARVLIRLTRDDDYWVIDVDDNGPGIPPSMRDSVFDPYVTTKSDGTGLGLAITKKIVVEHGGTIAAESSSLGGARLEVRLPVAGTAAAAIALEAASQASPPVSTRSGSQEK
jgi:signal transduction histidine kinase